MKIQSKKSSQSHLSPSNETATLQFKSKLCKKRDKKKKKVSKVVGFKNMKVTYLYTSFGTIECTDRDYENDSSEINQCPSSDSLGDLITKQHLNSRKRVRKMCKSSSKTSSESGLKQKNSIVKITHKINVNPSINNILQASLEDKKNCTEKDIFSLDSLMIPRNEMKPALRAEDNIGELLEPNELPASRTQNEQVSKHNAMLSSSGKKNRQNNTNHDKISKNEISNRPICSVLENSDNKNNTAVHFYELGCSTFLVVMKPESHLFLIGTAEIEIIKGTVEVLGYTLCKENKKTLIFSLQGSAHLSLTAKSAFDKTLPSTQTCDNNMVPLYEKIIALGLSDPLSHIISKTAENRVLFTITKNKTDKSSTVWPKFLEVHSSYIVFPPMNLLNNETRSCHTVEHKIDCLFETNLQGLGLKEFNEVSEWSPIENDIINQDCSKAILCGGKSVGKSSLLRYLVNKCLYKWKQVLVLDFDLGQCEFTLPGCISAVLVEEPLLGPNYSHLKEPVRSVHLGEVDVTKCPENYIEGCKLLIDYGKQKFHNIPWLINTMGFTRGFGVSLACGIINYVKPTLVVQIQSKDRTLNFPSLLEQKFVHCLKHSAFDTKDNDMDYKLYVIPSGTEQQEGFVSKSRGISPAECRNLVILSYMSGMLNSEMLSLSQVTPYMISFENVDLQTTNRYNLTKVQIAVAMNGNMVALCHKRKLNNTFPNCLGFGIVRGIDWQSGILFLITPLPHNRLSKVNCLIKGNVGLPDSLYYNQGEKVTGHIPYLATTSGSSTARFARRDFRSLPVTFKDNKQR